MWKYSFITNWGGGRWKPSPHARPPSSTLTNTHKTKLSKETRGIHLMLIATNKLTRMNLSEGRRSLLWPFWHWGHVSGWQEHTYQKRHAVTSIYISFKAHTYELWEKRHTACRVIWWGHLHVQLLYSRDQKSPCEYIRRLSSSGAAQTRGVTVGLYPPVWAAVETRQFVSLYGYSSCSPRWRKYERVDTKCDNWLKTVETRHLDNRP